MRWSADPVNTANGNHAYSYTDLSIPTRGLPLSFTRSYNSLLPTDGPLGWGWRHTWQVSLVDSGDGNITVTFGDAHAEQWVWDGSQYVGRTGIFGRLVKNGDGSFDLTIAPHTFDEVRQWLEPGQGQNLYGPEGCSRCHYLGYSGRTGVFELLRVSRGIRKLIADKELTQTIRNKAVEEGLIEFKHSALLKVAQGHTSIEEVLRSIPSEYLGLED